MRAAVYARVSDAKQKDNYSTQAQINDCLAYAAEHGYDVAPEHVFTDVHSGADLFDRPNVMRMLKAASERRFDAIVVWRLDRLTREPHHNGFVRSMTAYSDVKILSVTETIDDSDEGFLVGNVYAFAGKKERLAIKQRSQRGKQARLEAGHYMASGKAPYGYRFAESTAKAKRTRLVVYEPEARIVRRVFRDLASRALTAYKLAQLLNEEGVSTPSGRGAWCQSKISRIVHHPVYTGRAVANRWKHEKTERGTLTSRERDESEWVILPDAAPAIVDAQLADDAKTALIAARSTSSRNLKDRTSALLRAGYAFCGYCGNRLQLKRHSRTKEHMYVCQRSTCRRHAMFCKRLDAAVWDDLVARLKNPALIAHEAEARRDQPDPALFETKALDRRVKELDRELTNVTQSLKNADDDFTRTLLLDTIKALGLEKRSVLTDLEAVEQRRREWEAMKDRRHNLTEYCRRVSVNIERFGFDQKRLALEAMAVRVELWAEDHDPRYRVTVGLPVDDEQFAIRPWSPSDNNFRYWHAWSSPPA